MCKRLVAAVIGILVLGGTAWEVAAQKSSGGSVSTSVAAPNKSQAPPTDAPQKASDDTAAASAKTDSLEGNAGADSATDSTDNANVAPKQASRGGVDSDFDYKIILAIAALLLSAIAVVFNIVLSRKCQTVSQNADEASELAEQAIKSGKEHNAEIDKLKYRIVELESAMAKRPPAPPTPASRPQPTAPRLPPPPPPKVYKYLSSISGNCFRSVSDQPQNSLYRMFDELNGVANFEFFGDASTALASPDAYIYEMCDISGNLKGATTIKNISPGQITQQQGGWVVKTLAKIAIS